MIYAHYTAYVNWLERVYLHLKWPVIINLYSHTLVVYVLGCKEWKVEKHYTIIFCPWATTAYCVMSGRLINFRPEACARTKSGHGLAHACSCSLGIEFLCWVDCSLKLMTKTSGISGCLTEESCSMSCKDCTGLMPVLRKKFHSKKNHCVTRVC